jgi:hypothetical protein
MVIHESVGGRFGREPVEQGTMTASGTRHVSRAVCGSYEKPGQHGSIDEANCVASTPRFHERHRDDILDIVE